MRTVQAIHMAVRADIDELVTRRALPGPTLEIDELDPFLFLNHHGHQVYPPGNRGLPFGPHPHRGFETVTFILSGSLLHKDSSGYESVIEAGGVQWMTAGSGLIHAELSPEDFKSRGGEVEILQLWVNLPSHLKMTKPSYVGLQKRDIPSLALDEGRVVLNAVSGVWGGTTAPIQSLTDVHLSTVSFKAGGKLSRNVDTDRTVFFYVVKGRLKVNGKDVEAHQLVEFGDDNVHIEAEALSDAVILFGHGAPYGEPVKAYGPFVMNTEGELVRAFEDYRQGKFGAWKG